MITVPARIAMIVTATLALSLAISAAPTKGSASSGPTSAILDFAPTRFPAKAEAKFFYSINMELKFSDQIDPNAPTLLRADIRHFLVSPDESRIAVVAGGRLLIVGGSGEVADVAKVDSGSNQNDRPHFRGDFQWSRDSKSLYVVREILIHPKGSGWVPSDQGELWRYDVDSRRFDVAVSSFAARSFFLSSSGAIYYSVPRDGGLKVFDGRSSTTVGTDLRPGDRPFYSFPAVGTSIDYQKVLPWLNVRLGHRDGFEELLINERKYLSVTQGEGWDGFYYCTRDLDGVFLPGNKYFVLDTPYCGNYKGQLLFDLDSARYQTLPAKTRVFRTLNTAAFEHYSVAHGRIEVTRKIPEWETRQALLDPIEVPTPFVVAEAKGTISSTAQQPLFLASFSMNDANDRYGFSTGTDHQGQFDFAAGTHNPLALLVNPPAKVRQGTYKFTACKVGYHPATGTVVVSPTAPKDSLIKIQLKPGDVGPEPDPFDSWWLASRCGDRLAGR